MDPQELARERARERNYDFALYCLRGDFAAAKQMVNRYAIDARAFGNSALHYACAGGSLELARWIADQFNLTALDAYAVDNYALRQACRNGHPEVVRWLVGRFGAPEDIATSIHMADTHGSPAIAKWLAKQRYATAGGSLRFA